MKTDVPCPSLVGSLNLTAPMAKQATEPPAVIRISTNTIIGNKFYVAGAALPFERAEDMPPALQPLVMTDEPETDAEENTARGSFEMGVPYEMTPDGRLGRALRRQVERQVADLEAENEFEESLEQAAADAELPAEIAQDLQEANAADVARQAAQLGADARTSDDIADAAAADLEPVELFVRRGSRHYTSINKARLRAAEPVFLKNTDGTYEAFDICDSRGQPPTPSTIT